jgi:hypothetical protein
MGGHKSNASGCAPQPSTNSPFNGPFRRAERREIAGSGRKGRVNGAVAVSAGRHRVSTTSMGSRPPHSSPRCSLQRRSRTCRAIVASSVTRLTSVSLNSECSLRFADPTVSHASSTTQTFAWTYTAGRLRLGGPIVPGADVRGDPPPGAHRADRACRRSSPAVRLVEFRLTGAGRGSRTLTELPPAVFETAASTVPPPRR